MDLRPVNVLSLCSGVGGLDLGLRVAIPEARTVCYVEREAYAAELLAQRMETEALDSAPIWSDVATFRGAPWRGIVDIVIGGYPCQPFSLAGKRAGERDPRHLWPEVVRIVGESQPALCFFENVAGHVSLGLERVLDDLESLGYANAAGLFSAAEVGASMSRKRLFIVSLADSTRARSRRLDSRPWDEGERATFIDGRGEAMVVCIGVDGRRPGTPSVVSGTTRTVEGSRNQWEWRQDAARSDGATVGKSASERLQIGLRERGDDGEEQSAVIGSGDPAMGEPERRGREGWNECWTEAEIFGTGCDRIFPPRPDGDWGGVPPSLKPAVCRVADGLDPDLADRVDTLRAIGNGVVPAQAAYAFVQLLSCLVR